MYDSINEKEREADNNSVDGKMTHLFHEYGLPTVLGLC